METDDRGASGEAPSRKEVRATSPAHTKILPTELRFGDRLVDESGEWQVLARP